MSFNPKPYKRELQERRRSLSTQIKALEKEVYDSPSMTDNWFKKYTKLNGLRVDLMTVKSHLKNLGKKIETGIIPITIDRNHIK